MTAGLDTSGGLAEARGGVADDDMELLAAWRAGDARAGSRLFERYYPTLVRFFANKISEDPTDLVQETFAAFVDSRTPIDEVRRFRSFLFGIAYNRLKMFYVRARKDARALDFRTVSVADLTPGPSTMMGRSADDRVLLAALRQLPLDHQVVLELFYWEDMTSSAIAEAVGEPHGTVRTRIRRARQLLDAQLARVAETTPSPPPTGSTLQSWADAIRASLDTRSLDDE
jgi:RNA polymerase sigma-70 factor (ECF subfamily)